MKRKTGVLEKKRNEIVECVKSRLNKTEEILDRVKETQLKVRYREGGVTERKKQEWNGGENKKKK